MNNWDPKLTQNSFNVPADRLYTKEHEWAKQNEDGTFTVGITAFAVDKLGDITNVSIDIDVYEKIQQDELFGTIESVKSVSDLFSPLTGVISKINTDLYDRPEILNNDPWNNGWLIITNNVSHKNLLTPEEYEIFIGSL